MTNRWLTCEKATPVVVSLFLPLALRKFHFSYWLSCHVWCFPMCSSTNTWRSIAVLCGRSHTKRTPYSIDYCETVIISYQLKKLFSVCEMRHNGRTKDAVLECCIVLTWILPGIIEENFENPFKIDCALTYILTGCPWIQTRRVSAVWTAQQWHATASSV
jgi:hypothetical protein